MTHQYESEILNKLMERDGFNIPSSVPPYEAEIKAYLINQVKQAYPKLTDYEAEWLLYNYTKHLPAEFPISSVSNVTEASFENVVPFAYQSATLKGSTKYRDIDTGDILDTFDETKNLELVSVKMPVLTTTGKNVFDLENSKMNEKSSYDMRFSSNGYWAYIVKLKPNTIYTISRKNTDGYGKGCMFRINNKFNYNDASWFVANHSQNENRQQRTVATGTDGYLYFFVNNNLNQINNLLILCDYIQIEEGSTATSYEPYKTNILSTPEDLELRGIGDVQDELDLLTGELIERIGEIMLDGKNDIEISISEASRDYASITRFWLRDGELSNLMVNSNERIMCDKLPVRPNGDYEKITSSNGLDIHITTTKLSEETVEAFKEYLSQNQITVQYPLEAVSVKTVDLTTVNEKGETTYFMPLEGTMHVQSSGEIIKPTFDMSVPVEATTQNLASFIDLETEE